MPVKSPKNLGRMELDELVNHLAEVKATLKNPGSVALTICECCIHVSIRRPGEEVIANVEVLNPADKKTAMPLSIK